MMKKPEIMSPARDWASIEACKNYADAVYFGTTDLSLRAKANNIRLSELPRFVKKCQKYGLKTYLTLNCTLYNDDLKKAQKIVREAKETGVDSLIVWDPAAIEMARKEKMPFLVSTQANISNWQSAQFYKNLGAKRIVLAREMTLKQIIQLKKKVDIQLEVFVHGAMCMAISGRCILSAYLYGKSANCGSCSQPCRQEWILSDSRGHKISNQGKYFMNSKDLCMIEHIPALIKAGIHSFKIEGRGRDAKYIETTARCYREAVDAVIEGSFTAQKAKAWKKELEKVYNRGFSTGFYFGIPGKEGISYDKADNISPTKKIQIGKILHYWPKIKVASVALRHRGLKLGEKIAIQGKTTFLEQKIKSLQIEGQDVKRAKKGQEVAIKVNSRVRRNDYLFITINKK